MANDVAATLADREKTYGAFAAVAFCAQDLKKALRGGASYRLLPSLQREALDMLCSKLARVVNGDPNYADSWHDIAGYAQLVETALIVPPAGQPMEPSATLDASQALVAVDKEMPRVAEPL